MKKILLLLLIFFILSGCEYKTDYKFLHSTNEITKIELGKVGEKTVNIEEGILNVFVSETEYVNDEIDIIISDFNKISCFKRHTDPGSLYINDVGIKITYKNGDFEIICEHAQATFNNGSYKPNGYYYFDQGEFSEFIHKLYLSN